MISGTQCEQWTTTSDHMLAEGDLEVEQLGLWKMNLTAAGTSSSSIPGGIPPSKPRLSAPGRPGLCLSAGHTRYVRREGSRTAENQTSAIISGNNSLIRDLGADDLALPAFLKDVCPEAAPGPLSRSHFHQVAKSIRQGLEGATSCKTFLSASAEPSHLLHAHKLFAQAFCLTAVTTEC
jgi:hypothetical protein